MRHAAASPYTVNMLCTHSTSVYANTLHYFCTRILVLLYSEIQIMCPITFLKSTINNRRRRHATWQPLSDRHQLAVQQMQCQATTELFQKFNLQALCHFRQRRSVFKPTTTKYTIITSSNSSVILRIMSACSMLWYMWGVMRPRHPEQWMKNWISSSSAASRSCLYASIHSSTTV